MVSLYRFFQRHKVLFYVTLLLSTAFFLYLGLRCQFEENIARLLPPTADNMKVDLAFQDLKVKDKIFIQVTGSDDKQTLTDAMDYFVEQLLEQDSARHNIENVLYYLNPADYLDLLAYLPEIAPTYLDITDEELDYLFTEQHLSEQIDRYMELLETEAGQNLYDVIAYDPAGILWYKVADKLQGGNSNRIYNYHLFSPDGTVCEGFVNPHLSSMDSGSAGHLLSSIKQAKKLTETQFEGVEVLYHGTVIQSANNARRIKMDLLYTIGIAMVLILLMLGVIFRQPSTNVLILLPILYGAVFALAGMYVCRGGMSIMALGIGAVVLGVALSYCLHVMIHFKYVGEAERTIREQAKPVFLGALTTIGAFAGLLLTKSSLLQDFGLFALLAMIGTTFASLVFMPHFFPKKNVRNERAFTFLEKINNYEIDKKNWVLCLMAVYVITMIAFSGKVEFDPNLRHINYTAPEVVRSQQLWATNNDNGQKQQYYAAYGNTLEETLTILPQIEAVCDSLKAENVITSYTPVSTLLPSEDRQWERIRHWQEYFTPTRQQKIWNTIEKVCRSKDLEADMFAPFMESMAKSYEPLMIAAEGIIPEELMCNVVEQVGDKWLVFLPVRMSEENLLRTNDILSAEQGCLVLDPFYYTTDMVALMNDDFNTILGISALFVFVVLLLSFRRIILALIAFLPMGLSWYVVLGAMYLTGHQFNLINIVVSSFIFGIGVDYSIFIMDGMLAKARGKDTQLLGYHKTAITISATILVICMLSLLFAVHPAIQSIGFASLVGMITTMLLSYTLQPWLLRMVLKLPRLRKYLLK